MIKIFLSAAIASTIMSSVAYAQDKNAVDEKKFYIGGAYGTVNFDDDGLASDTTRDIGLDGFKTQIDAEDNAQKIYAGYRFNDIVSIEVAYTDYGNVRFYFDDFLAFNIIPVEGGTLTDWDISSFAVSANLGYAFENGLRPFGVIGLSHVEVDEAGGTVLLKENNAAGVHFGFGVEYSPNALGGVAFRVGYEGDMFALEAEDRNEDDPYILSVESLYLSADWSF